MLTAFVAGAVLPPGAISGDAGRTLATFLGLIAASILPSITLLVNSMSASGRSVNGINRLEQELQQAMDALFLMFGCVGVVVLALVALATEPPALLEKVPYLTDEILPRGGQTLVVMLSAITLGRVGQIPAILRRSLSIRHEIAVDEARRKTLEKAPTSAATQALFKTHPDFGKSRSLEEFTQREG